MYSSFLPKNNGGDGCAAGTNSGASSSSSMKKEGKRSNPSNFFKNHDNVNNIMADSSSSSNNKSKSKSNSNSNDCDDGMISPSSSPIVYKRQKIDPICCNDENLQVIGDHHHHQHHHHDITKKHNHHQESTPNLENYVSVVEKAAVLSPRLPADDTVKKEHSYLPCSLQKKENGSEEKNSKKESSTRQQQDEEKQTATTTTMTTTTASSSNNNNTNLENHHDSSNQNTMVTGDFYSKKLLWVTGFTSLWTKEYLINILTKNGAVCEQQIFPVGNGSIHVCAIVKNGNSHCSNGGGGSLGDNTHSYEHGNVGDDCEVGAKIMCSTEQLARKLLRESPFKVGELMLKIQPWGDVAKEKEKETLPQSEHMDKHQEDQSKNVIENNNNDNQNQVQESTQLNQQLPIIYMQKPRVESTKPIKHKELMAFLRSIVEFENNSLKQTGVLLNDHIEDVIIFISCWAVLFKSLDAAQSLYKIISTKHCEWVVSWQPIIVKSNQYQLMATTAIATASSHQQILSKPYPPEVTGTARVATDPNNGDIKMKDSAYNAEMAIPCNDNCSTTRNAERSYCNKDNSSTYEHYDNTSHVVDGKIEQIPIIYLQMLKEGKCCRKKLKRFILKLLHSLKHDTIQTVSKDQIEEVVNVFCCWAVQLSSFDLAQGLYKVLCSDYYCEWSVSWQPILKPANKSPLLQQLTPLVGALEGNEKFAGTERSMTLSEQNKTKTASTIGTTTSSKDLDNTNPIEKIKDRKLVGGDQAVQPSQDGKNQLSAAYLELVQECSQAKADQDLIKVKLNQVTNHLVKANQIIQDQESKQIIFQSEMKDLNDHLALTQKVQYQQQQQYMLKINATLEELKCVKAQVTTTQTQLEHVHTSWQEQCQEIEALRHELQIQKELFKKEKCLREELDQLYHKTAESLAIQTNELAKEREAQREKMYKKYLIESNNC